jgi:hypothetical protein
VIFNIFIVVANSTFINPLSPELNPICYWLALLAHDFLHVSRIRVKSVTLRLLMSYIYDINNLRVKYSHLLPLIVCTVCGNTIFILHIYIILCLLHHRNNTLHIYLCVTLFILQFVWSVRIFAITSDFPPPPPRKDFNENFYQANATGENPVGIFRKLPQSWWQHVKRATFWGRSDTSVT